MGVKIKMVTGDALRVPLFMTLAILIFNFYPVTAVVITQIVATVIAAFGLFMTPLGWAWALFAWG